MSNSNDDRILSCGHKPSPHSDFTTGTSWLPPEGDLPKREVCWDCSLTWELLMMRKTGLAMLYLQETPELKLLRVVTWPGQLVSLRVQRLGDASGAFRGYSRKPNGFYIRFEFDGYWWSGYTPGVGSYIRARRTKRKA